MKTSQTTKCFLLVVAIAAVLLFGLFLGMAESSAADERVARAAAPSTPEPPEAMEEGKEGSPRDEPDPPDDLLLWTAIEAAYHDGDRERLVDLGEQLPVEEQANFERILADFDSEDGVDAANVVAPGSVTAPDVGRNGNSCSYATIGAAIAAASDGDTIYIPSGNTYPEQLGSIDKDLTFVASVADCSAEDPSGTSTIDGGGADGGVWGGLASTGLTTTLTFRHISLQNARANYGGVLYIDSGSTVTLDDSVVTEGQASSFGGGVRVYRNAALILQNRSIIHTNAVTGTTSGGGGVSAYQGAITMTGNSAIGTFAGANTSADRGGGVYLHSSSLYVEDSFISPNDATAEGGGIYAFGGSAVELHGNSIIGGDSSLFINTAQHGGGAYLAGPGTGLVLSDTSSVVMNQASGDGGGVYAEAEAYCTIRGGSAEVMSNTASADGGGFYLAGDGTQLNMIFGGGRIEGNEAQASVSGGGGGVYVTQGASVYAEASTIERNTTSEYGGGLHVAQDGAEVATSVILNNSTVVTDNSAFLGGGLYIADDGAEVVIDGSRVENNQASMTGGGIRIFGDSRLDVRNGSAVKGNQATGFGGGLAMFTGTVSLDLVTMTYNTSNGDGGAILQSRGLLAITDGDIRFNSADDDGGGIYRSGGLLMMEAVSRSSFLSVNDANRGGGLYDTSGEQVDVYALSGEKLGISTNFARDVGGALFLTNATTLNAYGYLIISTNAAANDGGGLYANDGQFVLDGDLSSQTPQFGGANDARNGNGGAIYAENGATIALYNVELGSLGVGNSADQDGGGIFADNSVVLLRDTRLVGNMAGDDGGGAYAQNGSLLTIRTSYSLATPLCDPATLAADEYCSELRENEANSWGAGLHVDGSTATVEDTAFIDNVGLSSGGSPGAAILVDTDATVTARNVLFTGQGTNGNTNVHVYTDGSYTSIHSTYAGNGDRPLFVVGSATATLTNNVMWDNGADGYYMTGATIFASCNDTENALGGTSNISADPHFVTTTRGAYRLGIGSPAVDACAGSLDHDLDNVRRPINAAGGPSSSDFDMGAFERKAYIFLPIVLKNGP